MKAFLSHTSSDKDLVGLVHQKLENQNAWYDAANIGKRSIASTLKKLRTAVIGGSWLLLFSNPFWKFFRPW